jgi:hypothetical protein
MTIGPGVAPYPLRIEEQEDEDDNKSDCTYRPESGYGNRMHRARGKRPERIREEVKDDKMR